MKKNPAGQQEYPYKELILNLIALSNGYNFGIQWRNNMRQEQCGKNDGLISRYVKDQQDKNIRNEILKADFPKFQRFTSNWATEITNVFEIGTAIEQVNRWTLHSDAAASVQIYFD
ncbi:MAG: hypothetical protein EZS28_022366 [Streblomastix strix]|uniref:Uncharacterized protein n=1 Tax=Streblomastix strix TaxID=222440 RepID=A0A5J4VHK9_9EUKA|nr:MAG: hypothetical protein EZS28_022366 [Streblomastix strix]